MPARARGRPSRPPGSGMGSRAQSRGGCGEGQAWGVSSWYSSSSELLPEHPHLATVGEPALGFAKTGAAAHLALARIARADQEDHALEGPFALEPGAQRIEQMSIELPVDLGAAHPEGHRTVGFGRLRNQLRLERSNVDAPQTTPALGAQHGVGEGG